MATDLTAPPRLHREGAAPYSVRLWEAWKRQGLGNRLTPAQATAVVQANPSILRAHDVQPEGQSLSSLAAIAASRCVRQVNAQRAPLVGADA